MRISVIFPEKGVHPNNKNWMWYVFKELDKKHDILFNRCDEDCDVMLGMSIAKVKEIERLRLFYPNVPLITYNWDMHPMLQPEVGDWRENGWKELMEQSIDIWTQTYYHAKLSEELTGLRHFVMPICGLDFEFEGIEPKNGNFALMASRRVPYKGFDLFEEGCKELDIDFVSRHPDYDDRDGYVKQLSECKVLVVASEEEANTPMSGYEAAFLKKPLLLSDIDANIEEWEDSAIYFKKKDKEDFKKKLKEIYEGKHEEMGQKAYEKAKKVFTVEAFVNRIDKRLCEVLL